MNTINCQFPINLLSYGLSGLNIAKALIGQGKNISLFPIGQVELQTKEDLDIIQRACDRANTFNNYAPSVRLFHQFSLAERIGKATHYGWSIFELDEFNTREKHHLNSCDELIVSSKWAYDIIHKELDRPSHIVPLGVDRKIFHPDVAARPQLKLRTSSSTFVVLHAGKIEERKGIKETIAAFNRAFKPADDVELWLFVPNRFTTEKEWATWNEYIFSPANNPMWRYTKLINQSFQTQQEVAELMSQANVCIWLSKAEGFNLPALESMSMGKDVILTNYSAHTEYATKENSHLVEIDGLERAYDGKWFNGKIGQWAHIGDNQIDQAADYMKFIYQDTTRRTPLRAIEIAQQFTWENTAKELIKVVC